MGANPQSYAAALHAIKELASCSYSFMAAVAVSNTSMMPFPVMSMLFGAVVFPTVFDLLSGVSVV
jgi:hypothetical protein